MFMHTTRWHDSVHESIRLTPHTVTHDCGVGSFDKPPKRRSNLSEAQTRSQTKDGSAPSSSLEENEREEKKKKKEKKKKEKQIAELKLVPDHN